MKSKTVIICSAILGIALGFIIACIVLFLMS